MTNTITTKLNAIYRLNNTVNGNPRADFITEAGNFRSQSDAGFMYGVENDKPVGKTVTLTLTKAGMVTNLKVS